MPKFRLPTTKSKVIIQGVTGKEGRFHAEQMRGYASTQVVGGVAPGKGGEWVEGLPVFDSVQIAVEVTGADVSVIFVPKAYATDAIYEAVAAGISLIVCITEGIPLQDMMRVYAHIAGRRSRLLGPNCPGVLVPGQLNVGIIPAHIAVRGTLGIVSKSGALTYDVANAIKDAGIGVRAIVGVGADPIVGTSFTDVLEMFENDPDTEQVVLLGEIGGRAEIDAAEFIKSRMTKRVIAYVAGRSAPPDRRMGHAGAIIEGGRGTVQEKEEALHAAGVLVVDNPEHIADRILQGNRYT